MSKVPVLFNVNASFGKDFAQARPSARRSRIDWLT